MLSCNLLFKLLMNGSSARRRRQLPEIERDGMPVSQRHRLAQAFDGDGGFENLLCAHEPGR